jgi:hypothetical protein
MIDLKKLGFKDSTEASIKSFQDGWNLGTRLAVDGIVGPKTTAAYLISVNRRADGKPTASAHFWFTEFACKCGRMTCPKIKVVRELLVGLEKLRALGYPRGLRIVSGYRCPDHNAAVGGARNSQHMYGCAADLHPVARADAVLGLHAFSGVGAQGSLSGLVRHVDVRHAGPKNVTGSSTAHPSRWHY